MWNFIKYIFNYDLNTHSLAALKKYEDYRYPDSFKVGDKVLLQTILYFEDNKYCMVEGEVVEVVEDTHPNKSKFIIKPIDFNPQKRNYFFKAIRHRAHFRAKGPSGWVNEMSPLLFNGKNDLWEIPQGWCERSLGFNNEFFSSFTYIPENEYALSKGKFFYIYNFSAQSWRD